MTTNATLLAELENVPAPYSAIRARFIQDLPRPNFGQSIVLQWSGREEGRYRVSASETLQVWSQFSNQVTGAGTTFRFTNDLGSNAPTKQFYRVELEQDGGPQP